MTLHRRLPLVVLAAALALGACTGTSAQKGDSDNQGSGTTPEEQQGTILNDTTPHRPGVPSPGVAGGEGVDENEQAERTEVIETEKQ